MVSAPEEEVDSTPVKNSIWQDLAANALIGHEASAPTLGMRLRALLTLRYQSVLTFRVAQAVGRRSALLAGLVKQWNQLITGADVAWQARVGAGLVLHHPVGVVVGPYVVMGADVQLQQGVTLGGDGVQHVGAAPSPILGDGVIVGAGARVIGAVRIDDGCIVGANAVVTRSSAGGGTVAVGIPAVWRQRSALAPSSS